MEQSYRHPAFPQPEDDSIALWRYLDFNKFEGLVNEKRLFMPLCTKLGCDKLEGTRPEGDLKYWNDLQANASYDEQKKIIKHNYDFLSGMAKLFRDNFHFVSCWHRNEYENFAMWQCYTTSPESVAIKTKYNILRECLPNYVDLGLVKYIDYSNERLPTDDSGLPNMFQYIMHKDVYYASEQEVRAVAFRPPINTYGYDDFYKNFYCKPGDCTFLVFIPPVDIKILIRNIIIHPEASTDFENKVIEICKANGLPKPSLSRYKFRPIF